MPSVTEPGLRLPFGLRDGVLVAPSEVERGLACACVCPACKEPLIARKGPVRTHHFAHSADVECAHGVETALHLAAKEVIASANQLWVPSVTLDVAKPTAWVISLGRFVTVDEVVLEQREGHVVPDVVVTTGGRRFFVEIAVTHKVDAAKRERLREMGVSTLEISVDRHLPIATLEDVAAIVVDGTDRKKWVVNTKQERVLARVVATALRLPVVESFLARVDGCPLPPRKPGRVRSAYVFGDCSRCEYRLTSTSQEVLCLGRQKVGSYAEWEEWRGERAQINNRRGE